MIDYIFNTDNKNLKGLANELLISGNLHNKGANTLVLNDCNPNFDIKINKGNKTNYIECKLDTKAEKTNNLYFEFWNYTYNRPTGINNKDLNTLYCHTFKYGGKWVYILNKRKVFI